MNWETLETEGHAFMNAIWVQALVAFVAVVVAVVSVIVSDVERTVQGFVVSLTVAHDFVSCKGQQGWGVVEGFRYYVSLLDGCYSLSITQKL